MKKPVKKPAKKPVKKSKRRQPYAVTSTETKPCALCNELVDADFFFCYGCKEVVCGECDRVEVVGEHSVAAHGAKSQTMYLGFDGAYVLSDKTFVIERGGPPCPEWDGLYLSPVGGVCVGFEDDRVGRALFAHLGLKRFEVVRVELPKIVASAKVVKAKRRAESAFTTSAVVPAKKRSKK